MRKIELILKIIKERRSVRKYASKRPSKAQIKKILEAGRWAPSGLNNQPWRFKVVTDSLLKEELARLTVDFEIIISAPVLICVFLNKKDSYSHVKDLLAVGACIQNMLLSIQCQGLSGCWLGEILNKKEKVNAVLRLKKENELMAVIALGSSDEKICKSTRKPLKKLLI